MLLLLPLCIVVKQKGHSIHKGKVFWSVIGIAIAGAVICFVKLNGMDIISSVLFTERYVPYAGQNAYSIMYYLQHPGELIQISYHTAREMGHFYVDDLAGGRMCNMQFANFGIFIKVILLMVILSMIPSRDDRFYQNFKMRFILFVIAFLGVAIGVYSMLFTWTPIGSDMIMGIQGRYFLPIIFPLFVSIGYWKKPVVKYELDAYYALAITGVSYASILYMLGYIIEYLCV